MLMTLLVVPLVLFILVIFLWPVARFLALSVDNSDISSNLPQTFAAIGDWQPSQGPPPEAVLAALVGDLANARHAGSDGVLAQLINQRLVGTRFLVIKTARDAAEGRLDERPVKDALLAAHPGWAEPALWTEIIRARGPLTDYYLLGSLDLQRSPAGGVEAVPADRALFLNALGRTVWISFIVTVLCAVLSLPLAQAIVSAPPRWSRVMFAMVLFPLWTSLLVRTVIWIIVLQKNGPVNAALVATGLLGEPLTLIYTRFSLYVAMVQVLLPLMVLSLVSVMRRVPTNYMKAALSLGAPWLTAWRRVQLPLIMPGILAGSAIVFVFALGYYITPMLVGGPTDQMISSYIAFYTNTTLNWGLAAALSVQLLLILMVSALLFWTARAFMRSPAEATQ
ncbi:MAG: ABC transporter permease [Rhizobiaceae bacterium]|nr:ABC transporter permease [Rhizobiaceae bacterium]